MPTDMNRTAWFFYCLESKEKMGKNLWDIDEDGSGADFCL